MAEIRPAERQYAICRDCGHHDHPSAIEENIQCKWRNFFKMIEELVPEECRFGKDLYRNIGRHWYFCGNVQPRFWAAYESYQGGVDFEDAIRGLPHMD